MHINTLLEADYAHWKKNHAGVWTRLLQKVRAQRWATYWSNLALLQILIADIGHNHNFFADKTIITTVDHSCTAFVGVVGRERSAVDRGSM